MMFRTMMATLSILFLLISPVQADTPTGSFAVKVPSKNPFVATVTLSNGAVTGFTMERNEIVARSAAVSTKGIDINVEFLGSCGAGSQGQMKIDISGDDLVFRQWKGRCAAKNANFNVRKKIGMTKQ